MCRCVVIYINIRFSNDEDVCFINYATVLLNTFLRYSFLLSSRCVNGENLIAKERRRGDAIITIITALGPNEELPLQISAACRA